MAKNEEELRNLKMVAVLVVLGLVLFNSVLAEYSEFESLNGCTNLEKPQAPTFD